MATPFMDLELPIVSTTIGPEWASMLNLALESIDEHDHSDGKGTPVTPAGLNINADLEFNSNDATELRSTRFDNQGAALNEVADIRCLYVSGGDLYYNNAAGTPIQLTSGAGLNAASIGAIGGDFATSSAAVTYSNSSKKFTFTQSSGINAHLDVADVIIREDASSANGVTLQSPNSLSTGYNWIFPTGLPTAGQTRILTIDSSGQVGAVYDTDGSTLEVSSNTLRVKDSGIVTAKIADLNVTTGKIAAGAVTPAKLSASNHAISSSCATYNAPSSFAQVTNLSVSITTNGRPVHVGLMSGGNTTSGYGSIKWGALSASQGITIRILRGATVLAQHHFVATSGQFGTAAVSSIQFLDTPSAGTYTYTIEAQQANPAGSGNRTIEDAVLFAREV